MQRRLEISACHAVMLGDIFQPSVDFVVVVLARQIEHHTLLRQRADPVTTEHDRRRQLQQQDRLADRALPAQQRDVPRRNAIRNDPFARHEFARDIDVRERRRFV
jgi:hypothetical protein